jgi:protein tyrosine phosphatase (PTP) superfamily phosphohydrolase (DUF442 family)
MEKMKKTALIRLSYKTVIPILFVCAAIPAAFGGLAQEGESNKKKTVITVENFGRVNDHIYRGGQPKGENYGQLASLGVKTILDLRADSEVDAKLSALGAGLRYINLPMAPKQYPQRDAAQQFLAIVNDQANWPVYVHCAGGRHRTGAMIAVYRISMDGWDYVNDYYRDWQASHPTYIAAKSSAQNSGGGFSKLTSFVERPIKRIYRARPILK